MNQWLSDQVRQVVAAIRTMHSNGTGEVWLHYRRGALVASSAPLLAGYERLTAMSAPLGKSEIALTEWVMHEARRVPCCP